MRFLGDGKGRWGAWLVAIGLASGCAKGGDIGGTGFGLPVGGTGAADAGDDGDDGDDGADDDGADGPEGGACLANNCSQDLECAGCEDGANICNTDEGRCVQCDPETQVGCEDGEQCTEYGNCVPEGQECPTADGLPTVDCDHDADCAACDPDHQVCDTDSHSCVACSLDNAGSCQTTDICIDGECTESCPDTCDADADCASCGGDGHEAHACNAHHCAQCSATHPCPGGLTCNGQGACVEVCGIPGQVAGTCNDDSDCAGCPGDSTNCVAPINGGHGSCGAQASGCSDIGHPGVVVLPEPFDQVTNLCSDDSDCDGVGVLYNVGQLLRDLTGIDSIDDANIEYPMASCADATVDVGGSSISCGICVPCQTDNDCMDIDIDDVAGDAFGPLGAIATAILLDQLFGDNAHTIHMYCSPVAGDYGACLPCPSLLSDCSAGGGGPETGTCDHDVCTEGGALNSSCSSCAAAVCEADAYCCNNAWDSLCVGHVEEECAGSCSGGGGGGSSCSHSACTTGSTLVPSCSSCVDTVCEGDAYCCQGSWDSVCVGEAEDVASCGCDGGGSGGSCFHDECETGGPLDDGCSSCADDICGADPYCCTTEWDSQCVGEAQDSSACSC